MKILVAGGAGFIGSHLVELLVEKGHDVVCTIFDKGKENYLDHSLKVERKIGDIRNYSFIKNAMNGCDKVFNLVAALNVASSTYDDFFSINVEGARNIMEAALKLGVKKVVHTSSAVTIKENATRVNETHLHKGDFDCGYTMTKFKGEKVVFEYGARGVPVTVVNPTVVYGPRDTHTLSGYFKLHLEPRIRIVSFVNSIMNLMYVKDAAIGHILAMEKGRVGHKYLLGGGEISIGNFLSLLDKVAGVKKPVIKVPGFAISAGASVLSPLFSVFGKTFPILKAQVYAMKRGAAVDISKAKKELGLSQTPLEEGLRKTLEWYKEKGYLKY